jgi:RNA polymerase primary sigma factor
MSLAKERGDALKRGEDVVSLYLRDLNRETPLSRPEEDAVARKAAGGDPEALNKLVSANLRFVVTIAKRYQGKGLHLADLIAEGNCGLIMAAGRFDPEKGYHFITYAVWWIRQAILKAIYDKSRAIRLPVNRVAELSKIERVRKDIDYRLSASEKARKIASGLGMDENDVRMLMRISREPVSLDAPSYNDEAEAASPAELISDTDSASPIEETFDNVMRDDVEEALSGLEEGEARVLRYRYGLGESMSMSFRELGGFLGMTKERVRQIEKNALKRLAQSDDALKLRAWLD